MNQDIFVFQEEPKQKPVVCDWVCGIIGAAIFFCFVWCGAVLQIIMGA